MLTTPLPRLNQFGMPAPCSDDVRGEVAALDYRNSDALWRDIANRAGVAHFANLLSLEELHSLSGAMIATEGPVGLIGRGFSVRVATYETLASVNVDDSPPIDSGRRVLEGLLRTRVPEPTVLRAVSALGLLSSTNQMRLNDDAQAAASTVDSPIGTIGLMLGSSQVLAGKHGLENFEPIEGNLIEWSFCATTLRRNEPYVVNDTHADVMHRSNPIVKLYGLRAYIGVPLVTSDGLTIGTLCAMDLAPRQFSSANTSSLQRIAAGLMTDLEAVSCDLGPKKEPVHLGS